ncbi:chloride channel protein [Flavobacterium sp. KACC 22758]|uniref:chloride channel protein n=1 Tax=Flavobacterium sp. KACC 22758 TaxID=3025667 RepID=UPI002366A992|nr:chloride channel protein [Flavobacterium sp. KACC 22758]WDF58146.1 chloride channel protein [Flavobacterium sp. KACC 22758]
MLKKQLLKTKQLLLLGQQKLSRKQFIFLSSVLIGITSAVAVIFLKAFAHWVYSSATYINGTLKLSFINSILPVIGILLTVLVVKKILGGSLEKGTSQILYTVARKASIIPKKQMYAQIMTSSLTVGLGGSAGLESPIVITGAAFGSNYAQQFRLSYQERTLLIGCGVAAGIAAAFNAPIAGVLFAIEVLLVDVTISAFTPIMIAAATGALVSAVVLNENILLAFREKQSFDYHNIPFYVLMGLFTGFTAVFYARNFLRTEHTFAHLKYGPYKKAVIGASILGLMIFIFPTLFGEGYESIKTLADKDPGKLLENTLFSDFASNDWMLLLFVGTSMLLKAFASGITLGSGGNGGNFAPSLFLGSYAGYFFSKFLNLTGLTNLPVGNFTLVGMAGILSGLFHAPLTAIFLIAEITGGYDLMIPLMIVASVSFAVSKRFEKHSLDVKNLARKGNAFTSNKDANILCTLEIEELIRKDYLTVGSGQDLEDVAGLLAHSDQVIFAAVDDQNELEGLVYFNDIREVIFDNQKSKNILVRDIMAQPMQTVHLFDSMETVMKKFEKSGRAYLPVLKNGKYYGFITKSDVLESYRNRLKSMIFE